MIKLKFTKDQRITENLQHYKKKQYVIASCFFYADNVS